MKKNIIEELAKHIGYAGAAYILLKIAKKDEEETGKEYGKNQVVLTELNTIKNLINQYLIEENITELVQICEDYEFKHEYDTQGWLIVYSPNNQNISVKSSIEEDIFKIITDDGEVHEMDWDHGHNVMISFGKGHMIYENGQFQIV